MSPKPIVHRDQVHGDVHYDQISAALLDTKVMQRLGRVFQLGYSHLVFRGGTHTRLAHVMGAAHVGMSIVDKLQQNYAQKRATYSGHVVRPEEFLPCSNVNGNTSIADRWDVLRHLVCWGALLHDLAHIPLGHTLEDEFEGIFEKHDDFGSPRALHLWGELSEIFDIFKNEDLLPASMQRCKISGHQVWQTVMSICFYKDKQEGFVEFLSKELADAQDKAATTKDQRKLENLQRKVDFIPLLQRAIQQSSDSIFRPYMADIVANTICADYLDYLKRDPLNVGLDVLRDERVLSHFYVCRDKHGNFRMALALVDRHGKPRPDVCTGVVELVRQRYRFAESIYYHKTKVSASAMFAKAMSLVGAIPEVGGTRTELYRHNVEAIARELTSGSRALDQLKRECLPTALLDPEVGDESLHQLLMHRAFEQVEEAIALKDVDHDGGSSCYEKTRNGLRAIALLQAVLHRQLHKVAMSIYEKQFDAITEGAPDGDGEQRLVKVLEVLRKNKTGERDRLEREMVEAAGWPTDAILLYVPPRKSQAKGIETLAFDVHSVVPLNQHSAVEQKVHELNLDYQNLWRLLVLVHPEYIHREAELSSAVDALLRRLWTICEGDRVREFEWTFGVKKAISEAAWFHYIDRTHREAALRLSKLCGNGKPQLSSIQIGPWLEEAVGSVRDGSSLSSTEHADRAYVIRGICAARPDITPIQAARMLKQHHPAPDAVTKFVVRSGLRAFEGQKVVSDEDGSVMRRSMELDHLVETLVNPKSASQPGLPL